MMRFGLSKMPLRTDKEEWAPVERFPYYQVSTLGRIYSELTETFIQGSRTQWGHRKVNLRDEDGGVHTVGMALLVAQAFVEPPNPLCDQVILLDGDLWNVAAYNLAWRTRRHAWLYAHQLRNQQPLHYQNLRVANLDRNIEYRSIVDAGMAEGLIFDDIYKSCYTVRSRSQYRVQPYGHRFDITEVGV